MGFFLFFSGVRTKNSHFDDIGYSISSDPEPDFVWGLEIISNFTISIFIYLKKTTNYDSYLIRITYTVYLIFIVEVQVRIGILD